MSHDHSPPDGFVLSEAAMYSFICQDVYPDIVSFAAAIPDYLKALFLIPIMVERSTTASEIALRVARSRCADGIVPTGDTEDADLFSGDTFVNYDNEPNVPSSDPGSIFRMDDAMGRTRHQEVPEENVQVPTDTTYMEDVDLTGVGLDYPYRTEEKVRHSSSLPARPLVVRLALSPDTLEPRAPKKIRQNSQSCSVSFVSYDKTNRVFTFTVDCGNAPRTVQASLSTIDEVAMICDCPFWRWNGPEANAQSNSYLLGQPYGTAGPPDVRDPDREFWLCKHSYAVLKKLEHFVQEVTDENWDKDDDELLEEVDENWDRMEGVSEVPMDEELEEEIEADWDQDQVDAGSDGGDAQVQDGSEESELPVDLSEEPQVDVQDEVDSEEAQEAQEEVDYSAEEAQEVEAQEVEVDYSDEDEAQEVEAQEVEVDYSDEDEDEDEDED